MEKNTNHNSDRFWKLKNRLRGSNKFLNSQVLHTKILLKLPKLSRSSSAIPIPSGSLTPNISISPVPLVFSYNKIMAIDIELANENQNQINLESRYDDSFLGT